MTKRSTFFKWIKVDDPFKIQEIDELKASENLKLELEDEQLRIKAPPPTPSDFAYSKGQRIFSNVLFGSKDRLDLSK